MPAHVLLLEKNLRLLAYAEDQVLENEKNEFRRFISMLSHSNKTSFVVISIIIVTLITDISIIKIYYLGIHQEYTKSSMIIFIIISSISLLGQYFVLALGKLTIKKDAHLYRFYKIVTIVQYALTAILVGTIIEMLVTSSYATLNLQLVVWLSHGMAIIFLGLLSYRLFLWFTTRRNYAVLLYAISSLVLAINLIFTISLVTTILSGTKSYITPRTGVYTPFFSLEPFTDLVNNGYILSSIASFILTWCATAFLLRHYSVIMGKTKYWVILSLPLVYFLLQFQPLFLNLFSTFQFIDPISFSMLYTLVFTFSKPFGGVLFGIAFWTIARRLGYNNIVRNYVIVSAYGFVLLFLSNQAIVLVSAPYPPYGLVTISFVGLSSFLVMIGIYSSAISLAHDAKLRELIRTSALEETRLLDSIGMARMEEELTGRVLKIAKANMDKLEDETGIKTSLTDQELKDYLDLVQNEIKNQKRNN